MIDVEVGGIGDAVQFGGEEGGLELGMDVEVGDRVFGIVLGIILAGDVPYVWLFFPKEYKLVSTRVRGFVHVPDGMMRFRTVWLEP